jgi:ribonuclease HI
LIWDVLCDGGCPVPGGPGAFGFVVKEGCSLGDNGEHKFPVGGRVVASRSGFLPTATNNQAEYRAITAAAMWVLGKQNVPDDVIRFWGDSQLIVRQLTGAYRVNDETLVPFYTAARSTIKCLQMGRPSGEVSINWFRREHNAEADELCNQVFERRGIPLKKKRVKV